MRRASIVIAAVGIAAVVVLAVWFLTGLTLLAPNAGDPSHPRSVDETGFAVRSALFLVVVLVAALLLTRKPRTES